ncbi:MAG: hypothetical protein II189_09675 [Lachnospiraceae bacterium]|nr:hypothetical protein [Lachnospiraceae bacterium]MBQ4305315.1 hypothetical protein [Lachnospiraceae bacterium]
MYVEEEEGDIERIFRNSDRRLLYDTSGNKEKQVPAGPGGTVIYNGMRAGRLGRILTGNPDGNMMKRK